MSVHIEKADRLKSLADALMQGPMITPVLADYGDVVLTGSYPLDLMVWPDIDIQLNLRDKKDPVKQFLSLSETFLSDDGIKFVKLIHFTKGKNPKMPEGMYMGLKLMPIEGIIWKLDIWALEDAHKASSDAFVEKMKTQMTPKLRELIIELKTQMMGSDDRMPKLGSYTLYQAIFDKGLQTKEDLIAYLSSKGFGFDGK